MHPDAKKTTPEREKPPELSPEAEETRLHEVSGHLEREGLDDGIQALRNFLDRLAKNL